MCWLKSPKVDQLPNLILIPNLYQEKTCCNSDQTLFDTTALFKSIIVSCYKNSFHNVNRILIRILLPIAKKFTSHLLFLVRKEYIGFLLFFPSHMFQYLSFSFKIEDGGRENLELFALSIVFENRQFFLLFSNHWYFTFKIEGDGCKT